MRVSELIQIGLFVFIAVSFVVLGDTAGKLLGMAGVEPVLIAWSRFVIAALILLPFSGVRLREIPSLLNRGVVLRAIFITCGISCILTALKTEPIANVFGAFFIGPIVSYILAILFLGEKPSRGKTAFLGLGFAGVLLVVKPGFGLSTGMLFALEAGTFYGAFLAATRKVALDYRPRFLLIAQLMIGSALLTPLGIGADFPALTWSLTGLFLVSALGSAIGNFMLVAVSRKAEASLLAPLIYSQLITATILGIVVFGDWPDMLSLLGLSLILCSGFGSLFLHQKQQTASA